MCGALHFMYNRAGGCRFQLEIENVKQICRQIIWLCKIFFAQSSIIDCENKVVAFLFYLSQTQLVVFGAHAVFSAVFPLAMFWEIDRLLSRKSA